MPAARDHDADDRREDRKHAGDHGQRERCARRPRQVAADEAQGQRERVRRHLLIAAVRGDAEMHGRRRDDDDGRNDAEDDEEQDRL